MAPTTQTTTRVTNQPRPRVLFYRTVTSPLIRRRQISKGCLLQQTLRTKTRHYFLRPEGKRFRKHRIPAFKMHGSYTLQLPSDYGNSDGHTEDLVPGGTKVLRACLPFPRTELHREDVIDEKEERGEKPGEFNANLNGFESSEGRSRENVEEKKVVGMRFLGKDSLVRGGTKKRKRVEFKIGVDKIMEATTTSEELPDQVTEATLNGEHGGGIQWRVVRW